jgi:hypothetical protein
LGTSNYSIIFFYTFIVCSTEREWEKERERQLGWANGREEKIEAADEIRIR